MKGKSVYFNFIFVGVLVGSLLAAASAQEPFVKTTQKLSLGEAEIKINVYEKKGARITFFAPHRNEQTGLRIARELIAKKGGRLVEIESLDERGNPARQLKFNLQGNSYWVDPNRIYTENGLRCGGFSPEVSAAIRKFSADLLKIILAPDDNKLREGEKFLVAVHNNNDASRYMTAAPSPDLTTYAFSKYGKAFGSSAANFREQADGVYLSNVEADEDNFFFLSTPAFLSFFAEKGFNVVIQKTASKLKSADCKVDDGSLSIFAGHQNLPYINIEADAASGALRQLQMLEAVYELLQKMSENESKSAFASEKSESVGADRRR